MSKRRKLRLTYLVLWPNGEHISFDTLEQVEQYAHALLEEHGLGHA